MSEVGAASRAWVDYPGRLWINAAQMSARYRLDGKRIPYKETISQRALALPPAPPRPHR